MMTCRIFIGTSTGPTESVYTVTIAVNSQLHQTVSKTVMATTSHRTTLYCIYDVCKAITSENNGLRGPIDLIVYSGLHSVEFEWEEEYQKDHKFSKQTKDQDLWDMIIKLVSNRKISMTIRGQSLNKLGGDQNARSINSQ